MGYYSTFDLQVSKEDGSELKQSEFDSIVKNFDVLGVINYALGEDLHTYENVKWYAYREHIAFVSKLFPECLFTVKRDGEEPGDHEVSYFKDGKIHMTQARLVFDEFDVNSLKEVNLGELEKQYEIRKAQLEAQEAEQKRKEEILSSMSDEDKRLLGL